MAKEIEKKLIAELYRFKQIKHNTENLNEQMIGGVSNLGMGSHVERLLKRAEVMGEQEDVELDPDAEAEEIEGGDEEVNMDIDLEGGDEEVNMDIDLEGGDEIDTEVTGEVEDTTELDVTDLVTKQDEVNTELSDQKDILSKNSESLDDLMTKLSELESHLSSMDDMVVKIGSLEKKIEEYRPRTSEEQIGLRKHDSGPYNQTLSDFFTDKEEVFDKTGKKQYILTKDELENYNDSDIKKSFTNEQE